jgi:hypothetical protein
MACHKCGHANGMHDERGCVALNCSCDRYVPAVTSVKWSAERKAVRRLHLRVSP